MNARRSERMSTMMLNTTMGTTIDDHDVAEGLREAETRRETARTRLAEARGAVADLIARIAAARDTYREALAHNELSGGAPPSRAELAALEGLVPAAEDRVVGLSQALEAVERQWCFAKAAAFDAEAAEVRRETARRQGRINELSAQLMVLEQEIAAHADWIRTVGPIAATQLLAEAVRLRRER
jgi:chromosome segregation ATPase